MTTDMQVYVAFKIGFENVPAFESWAFSGRQTKMDRNLSFVERWNKIHKEKITDTINTWDAVDRMIAIWKEHFSVKGIR